jgi:subtilisin family serine protease
MRRAVLVSLICAAPLLCAPAHASASLLDRQALREAQSLGARPASTGGVAPLPLAGGPANGPRGLGWLAGSVGRQRVLVGVRSHGQLRAVAGVLRRLGAAPEAFSAIGVLSARVPSGTELAAALRGDRRVAYVERDTELSVTADPFDVPDPQHGGYKYTWFYDDVRAGDALAAAGGGSRRTVAVLDTGLDLTNPEFAGRVAGVYDTHLGAKDVTDFEGHGTFVSGLITAIDGNGIGGKGVAGDTKVLAIRASISGKFFERDLLRGIAFAMRRGADVLNLSLASSIRLPSVVRALEAAFYNDVLPVAASGNLGDRREAGVYNPVQFPASDVGGRNGGPGIGLSVAATRPDGRAAGFSTHNRFVSLAAPGASIGSCRYGVLSTLPPTFLTAWDKPDDEGIPPCNETFLSGGLRFAYGEGTSFSAPIAAGVAAVVWQVERRLASEQVADVLVRSARQTRGRGWNEFTGAGIVDGRAATALARSYDVTAPRARARATRVGNGVSVRMAQTRDRTEKGRELAGRVTYGLLVSRNAGRSFRVVARRRHPFRQVVALRARRVNAVAASACDRNGNCAVKRLGRYRLYR